MGTRWRDRRVLPGRILPYYARHNLSDLRGTYGSSFSLVPLQKLAFSEGWADFYSVAARTFPNIGNVNAPPVAYNSNLPERNDLRGPLDEIGVMQLFWDLCDTVDDGGDRVQLGQDWLSGVQALYKIISANEVKTVNGLIKVLPNIGNSGSKYDYEWGCLSAHGMSPKDLSMGVGTATNNQWNAGELRPTFKWTMPMVYTFDPVTKQYVGPGPARLCSTGSGSSSSTTTPLPRPTVRSSTAPLPSQWPARDLG